MTTPYILSIETSTRNFSLAVSENESVLAYRNIQTDKILSSAIIPAIKKVLAKAEISLEDIDAFAVGLGPGSFTSLRVGLATVKSLAYAVHKPLVGICSLDVVAAGVNPDGVDHVCVVMDARRNMVYAALYAVTPEGLQLQGHYMLADIKDVLSQVHDMTLFTGDAIEIFYDQIRQCKYALFAKEKLRHPHAQVLAKLACARIQKKDFDNINTLVPLYLYPEDCQVAKK